MDGALLGSEVAARLARAQAGADEALRLDIASLRPGVFGVLDATVRMLHPARPYPRRTGGEGLLQKVTLGDATGEVVLVLWDQETRLAHDGTFAPGALVRLRGATVQPAYRGRNAAPTQATLGVPAVELALGAGVVEVLAPPVPPPTRLEGVLVRVGEPEPVERGNGPGAGGPRVRAEAIVRNGFGDHRILVSDGLMESARALAPGTGIVLAPARPNPGLPGYWIAMQGCRLVEPAIQAAPALERGSPPAAQP